MLVRIMANDLALEKEYIFRVAEQASFKYKEYRIPKKKGGYRLIEHPGKDLKALQRWLLHNILRGHFPIHDAAAAYEKGKKIYDNAFKHRKARYLLRMDFRSFFPSLLASDINFHFDRYIQCLPDEWTDEDTCIFCNLTCRNGRLTIGAVTSPTLSNILCYDFDVAVSEHCNRHNVIYTRYADDMYFSCDVPGVLAKIESYVHKTVDDMHPNGLCINHNKTHYSSRKRRQAVTGLIITNDGEVSLGNERKKHIRSMVYKWERLDKVKRAWLSGMINYCRSIEPDFVNKLILKYGYSRLRSIQKLV